jgi:hypothetical protein
MKRYRIRRWIVDWLHCNNIKQLSEAPMQTISQAVTRSSMDIDNERSLNFNIFSAHGGRIVEVSKYNRQTDRATKNLYIITPEQEFGREIEKIITMECLR